MTVAVAPVRTGGTDRRAWVVSRGQALYDAFRRRGLPVSVSLAAAVGILPHAILETGWGRAEWNYNLGNIKCAGFDACTTQPDGLSYRAYRSAEEGTEAYVRLLEVARYRPALVYLLATGDGAGYYDRLMREGWTGQWSQASLDTYRSIARRLLSRA